MNERPTVTPAEPTEAEARALMVREERRRELAGLTFNPGGQMFRPSNGRELMDMANLMAGAGSMIKPMYRDKPGHCMGLIAICAPYGLNPLQVSWKTYRASKDEDAPIAFEAQVIVAMVNASGAVKGTLKYDYEGEGLSRRCYAYGTLRGDSAPVGVWSPPLSAISPKNSPLWKTDPDQQLAYYTGRAWCRRYKPEMLLGVYDVDEMEDVAIGPDRARDVTPPPAARVAPPRGGAMYRAQVPEPAVAENHVVTIEDGVVVTQAAEVTLIADPEEIERLEKLADQIKEWVDTFDAEEAAGLEGQFADQLGRMQHVLPARHAAIMAALEAKMG